MLNPRYILHPSSDVDALTQDAAAYWLAQARQAIEQRGAFHVALTGGSTPQGLYRLLATPQWANKIDWRAVQIYIGDERYVPHDHPDSNFGMIRAALLEQILIPPANLHPIPTDAARPEQSAQRYAETLQRVAPQSMDLPQLDLIMLGMGEDGHTASLFPDTAALSVMDQSVAAVYVKRLKAWRISMTYPCLNNARQVMVMVSGEKKAAVLAQVLYEGSEAIYPIQGVEPAGDMHWFFDQPAASMLHQPK